MSRTPHRPDAYRALVETFAKVGHLRAVQALLFWDSQTVMPPGADEGRGRQLETIADLQKALVAAPETGRLLARAERDADQLTPWDRANLREMKRTWSHSVALGGLAGELAGRSSRACGAWGAAKAAKDFSLFREEFAGMVDLQRRIAEAKAKQLDCELYDALLDQWDPGLTTATIDPLFAELEPFLADLVARRGKPGRAPRLPVVDVSAQASFVRAILQDLGYCAPGARLDHSAHPFTLGEAPGEARITTRYDPRDLRRCLKAAFHELGHALYEQNLPAHHAYQPVGYGRSASTHEGQALAMELQVCRSGEFLAYLAERLIRELGLGRRGVEEAQIVASFQEVRPGAIRVDADEVTYNLHIIMRYRIERQLLEGTLAPVDLPAAWDAEMQRLLGISPPDAAQGCLQDIQWASGLFGYFPTYALGTMKAAQSFQAARRERPGLAAELRAGDTSGWRDWSRKKIHRWGCFYEDDELLRRATGRTLSVTPLQTHLEARYGARASGGRP